MSFMDLMEAFDEVHNKMERKYHITRHKRQWAVNIDDHLAREIKELEAKFK